MDEEAKPLKFVKNRQQREAEKIQQARMRPPPPPSHGQPPPPGSPGRVQYLREQMQRAGPRAGAAGQSSVLLRLKQERERQMATGSRSSRMLSFELGFGAPGPLGLEMVRAAARWARDSD